MSKSDPYLIIKIGDKVLNVLKLIKFSFKVNILRILTIHSLTKKYTTWLNFLKMLSCKFKYGIMIQYWAMILLGHVL